MEFHVLTLFPEFFRSPLEHGRLARAVDQNLISVTLSDIRDYTDDTHKSADDYQFGGGSGMVLKPSPIFKGTQDILTNYDFEIRDQIPIILLSPQGSLLTQPLARSLASHEQLILICGHYAGVDERVREHLVTHEISVGDYILTGGELPALILMDAVCRFRPGVVGSSDSVEEDSITSGMLQHPLYTRPNNFNNLMVPEILLSGDHVEIALWRRHETLKRTLHSRPDLLSKAWLSEDDRNYLHSLGYLSNQENPNI